MKPSNCIRVAAVAAWVVSLPLRSGAESPPAAAPVTAQPRRAPSGITQALLAKLPKFVPPATRTAAASTGPDAGDLAGDVWHLPKMTVRPAPVTPESDFALLNTKGRVELSLQTHPGMRIGNVGGLNDIMTLTMQQDERIAAKKANLADQVQRSTLGDSELDKQIRGLTKALLLRSGAERDFPSVYLPPRESGGRRKR